LIVVVDASVLISAILKPGSVPERALTRTLVGPDTLIISNDVECEYREVILRQKFDRLVALEWRQQYLQRVIDLAQRVEPIDPVHDCRDPKDNKYLELAEAGSADLIVSGDRTHLLPMHPWRSIRICSPADYLALANGGGIQGQ